MCMRVCVRELLGRLYCPSLLAAPKHPGKRSIPEEIPSDGDHQVEGQRPSQSMSVRKAMKMTQYTRINLEEQATSKDAGPNRIGARKSEDP